MKHSYFPSLDGLRALAIMGVMAAHLHLAAGSHTEQGFLGVYAFFTLSGYLITSLLLVERQTFGSVSLARFWGRRAARLLPAIVALVLVLAVVNSVAPPQNSGWAAVAAVFYFANWRAAFSGDGSMGVLAHTWSLSVEEQFYVLWPLLLLGALAIGRRRGAIALAVAGIVTALVLRVALYDAESPWRAIRGTDTMMDMLLYGCLLALLLQPETQSREWLVRRVAPWSGWVGLAGLVSVMFVFEVERQIVHLVFGPIAAISTALLILHLVTAQMSPLARGFAFGPFTWIGRISYSLYLWHPIAYAVVLTRVDPPNLVGHVLQVVLAVAAAAGSFYVVERPINTRLRARLQRPVPPDVRLSSRPSPSAR